LKDIKPIIIGVLSVVLLGLVVYIVQGEFGDTDEVVEPPVETPEPDPEPIVEAPEEEPESEDLDEIETPVWYEGVFELPINGAAGYTSVDTALLTEPSYESDEIGTLPAGTPFEIIHEQEDFWLIETAVSRGWIPHLSAFVNLPDVMPSIIYNNTNASSSVFRTSYIEIPEITGEQLYNMSDYNERLDQETFIMPILYETAKKVAAAQEIALQNGESLKIYETFRPLDTQMRVNFAMASLAEENEQVYHGVNQEPWGQGWFISQGISNHQRGAAIDVSLARIDSLDERIIGDFQVPHIVEYTEYEMHTPMHELSADSVVFTQPIARERRHLWREYAVRDVVTEPSIRLQQYVTEVGMQPLPSEWWHFDDVQVLQELGEDAGNGDFMIHQTLNRVPTIEDR
jgi:D-alanyl-D-alanine dipeptidase